MPRLRDPQGHKLEVTQEQLDGKAPIVCDRCGWMRPAKPRVAPIVSGDESSEDSRS